MNHILFAIALMSSATMAEGRSPVEHIGKPMLGDRRLPFSDAVRVGDMLYLSGQVGLRPDGTLPQGIDAQARQAMDNIGAVLKGQGLGWGDVVKCTVMLDNIADWPAFNKVYVVYFPDGNYPARSALGVNGLALPRALIEIECQAYAGKK
jgi:reactive intermediate/imine deaminase